MDRLKRVVVLFMAFFLMLNFCACDAANGDLNERIADLESKLEASIDKMKSDSEQSNAKIDELEKQVQDLKDEISALEFGISVLQTSNTMSDFENELRSFLIELGRLKNPSGDFYGNLDELLASYVTQTGSYNTLLSSYQSITNKLTSTQQSLSVLKDTVQELRTRIESLKQDSNIQTLNDLDESVNILENRVVELENYVLAIPASWGEKLDISSVENFAASNSSFNMDYVLKYSSEYQFGLTSFSARALIMAQKVDEMFAIRQPNQMVRVLNSYYQNQSTAFNWGYGAYHTMILNTYKANPTDADMLSRLADVSEGIERYMVYGTEFSLSQEIYGNVGNSFTQSQRDLNKKILNPVNGKINIPYANAVASSSGDGYYDDTIWCVMALLESGQILSQFPQYKDEALRALQRAEQLMMFCISGWDELYGGGIYWHVSKETKNTCINGPFSMAAAHFYKYYAALYNSETDSGIKQDYKDRMDFYLQWAEVVFEWTYNTFYDEESGVFLDHIIIESGQMVDWKFTYNVGTPLSAASLLYDITGKQEYKSMAQQIALGSHNFFLGGYNADGSDKMSSNHSWFNVYLVQGYLDVAVYLDDHRYIQRMAKTLDYAWKNARNYYGFVLPVWDGTQKSNNTMFREVEVLQSAGATECFAIVGFYNNEHYKKISSMAIGEEYSFKYDITESDLQEVSQKYSSFWNLVGASNSSSPDFIKNNADEVKRKYQEAFADMCINNDFEMGEISYESGGYIRSWNGAIQEFRNGDNVVEIYGRKHGGIMLSHYHENINAAFITNQIFDAWKDDTNGYGFPLENQFKIDNIIYQNFKNGYFRLEGSNLSFVQGRYIMRDGTAIFTPALPV